MFPFFFEMKDLTPQEQKIVDLLQPLMEGSDIFLTQISIKPTNNIKVYLDADTGLDIARCAKINRGLYHAIEEAGLYPDGDFSLEVSSPGVDEPLSSVRQYKKNIGRFLEVILQDGTVYMGQLQALNDCSITLHIKGTKKAAPRDIELSIDSIKTAVVQIVF